jgi:DNA (cytosine-5)-methyltransferase 1
MVESISPLARPKDAKLLWTRGPANGKLSDKGAQTQPAVVADLCCGMGGLSLAARELGMSVVVGVDVSAQVARTFSKNFPEAEFVQGSVRSPSVLRQCSELLLPPIQSSAPSVVLSGPPCQGFSAAGSRNPVDPRNQILVAVARAIAHLEPRCALIENVSMVLAKKHAKRLRQFKETLAQAGYFVHGLLLDAADFGVAQKRKRTFFLITRKPLDENQVQERLGRLKQPELSVERALQGLPRPEVRPDRYSDEEDSGAFTNHLAMRHSKRVMEKIAALKPGTGPMSYRRLHPSRPSKTLFSGHRAPPAHFQQPRSITVREAARLQGFPDSFRVYGSFANQMEQVTNAVPPPLAKIVLQVLAELVGIPTSAHA